MKPTAKSQGKGIFLFNKLAAAEEWLENSEVNLFLFRDKHIYVRNILKILCLLAIKNLI